MEKAVINELCSGRAFMETMSNRREVEAAQEAASFRGGRTNAALGKCVLVTPQDEWFKLQQHFGTEGMHDKSLIRHIQKTHPEMAVARV